MPAPQMRGQQPGGHDRGERMRAFSLGVWSWVSVSCLAFVSSRFTLGSLWLLLAALGVAQPLQVKVKGCFRPYAPYIPEP